MKRKAGMVLFVLVMGTIFASILTAVNHYTAPLIEQNRMIRRSSAVLEALGFEVPEAPQKLESLFEAEVEPRQGDGRTVYRSGELRALLFEGSGLWGPIEGVVALESDLRTIRGVSIIHQEETPGLGGRIAEDSYLQNYEGKRVSPRLKVVDEGAADAADEVDGITGATMSVEALGEIINRRVKQHREAVQ